MTDKPILVITTLVKIAAVVACLVLLIAGFFVGRQYAYQQFDTELDGMALRIDAAENELMNIRASCDALLYGG